jgi:DeoR family transcriptional regulator, suf operon transcriptional repressor
MTTNPETSDPQFLDLLRKHGALSVSDLISHTGVTATAVRQRLNRLLKQGLIEREAKAGSRGRPSHKYQLTDLGRRSAGANFTDLAVALWQEVREIKDREIRRGLLQRLSKRMAEGYAEQIQGDTVGDRMESLAEMFSSRQIPFEVQRSDGENRSLPVLSAHACPYPELAEQDQSICAMERMMFSELLGENVKLSNCRLNGDSCCTFEPAGSAISHMIPLGPLVETPPAAVS